MNENQEKLVAEIDKLITKGMGRYTWAPKVNDDRVAGLIVGDMIKCPPAYPESAEIYPALFEYIKSRYELFYQSVREAT